MFDANKILGQLLSNPAAQGFAGGVAGGMLTSKGGRKMGKKALKYGGIAAVGALAYNAYRQHQQSKGLQGDVAPAPPQGQPYGQPQAQQQPQSYAQPQAAPQPAAELPAPPAGTVFAPTPGTAQANETGLLILRSMIAAARADGKLDGDEMNAVLEHADRLELDPESKSQLLQELRSPVDMETLVSGATTEELKAEVYMAALLAIEVDTDAERAYLAMLKARLGLDEDLVQRLHAELETA